MELYGKELSLSQIKTVNTIRDWYKKPYTPLTIGGYAGTGKTTVIAGIHHFIRANRIAFCAYTGKAANVLRRKLKDVRGAHDMDTVSTIHSLIYRYNPSTEKFELKDSYDMNYDLIVVDEASMVTKQIYQDLLSFGIPIIFVGDHGQLPPVASGSFNLMERPIVKMEEILRQLKDSPIIHVSMLARETGNIPFGTYGDTVRKHGWGNFDLKSWWAPEHMILTGRNRTRILWNQKTKLIRDMDYLKVEVDDRVVCLQNNPQNGVFNGMLGTITNMGRPKKLTSDKEKFEVMPISIDLEDDGSYIGYARADQFWQPEKIKASWGGNIDLWDIGYALTVHKSQGSQADSVLVIEEELPGNTHNRWLYTAVTRAATDLTILKGY